MYATIFISVFVGSVGEMLSKKIASILTAGLPSGMTPTHEAEVSFRQPTEERFKYVINELQKNGIGSWKREVTLDVSYSKLSKTNNTAFRVTIIGEDKVKKAIAGASKKDSITSFKAFVAAAKSEGHGLIEKTKNKTKSKPINDEGLILRIATEEPLNEEQIAKISGMNRTSSQYIYFRMKERYTYRITVGQFVVKVDATEVTSGKEATDLTKAMNKDYEIEVELTYVGKDVKKVAADAIKAFADQIERIQELMKVNMVKPAVSKSDAKSESSSSSSSSSSQYVEDGKVPTANGAVVPRKWMMTNRKGFFDWTYDTFNVDRYNKMEQDGEGHNAKQGVVVKLFPHQKIVRDFMQYHSPYRGILLYHGLGVGKTIASIAAAEGFVQNNKKVIVMIPASLETNYRDEIIKTTTHGNPSQKIWDLVRVRSKEAAALLYDHIHLQTDWITQKLKGKSIKEHPVEIWIPSALVDIVPAATSEIQRVQGKTNVTWDSMSSADHDAAKETLAHLLDTKFKFVRYNGISVAQLEKLGDNFFNDAFIVIDEAHNFISRVVNGGSTSIARKMYHSMMEATGSKIVLLSGTPIINHPFELSVMLNLARGPMTTYTFTLKDKHKGQGKEKDHASTELTNKLVEELIDHENVAPYIDQWIYSEAEQYLQVSVLPHGYMNSIDWNGKTVVAHKGWSKKQNITESKIVDRIHDMLQQRGFAATKQKQYMYAFPSKKEDFNKHFVDETDVDNPRVKNIDLFSRRLIGLVSYYRSAGEEYFPAVLPTVVESTPLCDTQFNTYVQARDKERRMESNKKRGGGLFGAKATVYRAFSRMACNFVFPKEIPRIFPNDIRLALRREIDIVDEDEDKQATSEENQKDKDPTKNKEKDRDSEEIRGGGPACYKHKKAECVASKDCEWVVGKGCKERTTAQEEAGPSKPQEKEKAKAKGKEKEEKAKDKKEDKAKDKKAKDKKAKVEEEKAKVVEEKPKVEEEVKPKGKATPQEIQRKYELASDEVMRKLEKGASKYLSLKALQDNYSAKLAKVYTNIDTSPGKVLLYTQFRSIEGIGVTRLILRHHDYVELKVESSKKEWHIVDAENVLQPKYDGKRFIIFDGDRDKTQIMLQIFNGMKHALPQSIQDQLKRFGGMSQSEHLSSPVPNLRGDIIKLLMITQSGAEGISLKCVRRVLILEPFWNQVRMDQVIGRAVRTGSHLELPQGERSVEVFIYTSVFTKKQLDENFTLRRLDHSVTSDTHILEIARKKDALIQIFMNALKSAAIDCRNNAAANKPTANGISCYAFPISYNPNEYSYTPSLQYDSLQAADYKNKLVRNKKVQGRVVSAMQKGERVKYVQLDDYPNKFFDYKAYKDAGVLVEAHM